MPLDDLAAQPGYQTATPEERRAMIAAEMRNDSEFRSLPAVEKQRRLLALVKPGEHPAAARLAGIQAGADIPPGVQAEGGLPPSTPDVQNLINTMPTASVSPLAPGLVEKMEAAFPAVEAVKNEVNTPTLGPSIEAPNPQLQQEHPVIAGAGKTIEDFARSMSSPGMLATLGSAMPAAVQPAVSALFKGGIASNVIQGVPNVVEAAVSGDPYETAATGSELALNAGMLAPGIVPGFKKAREVGVTRDVRADNQARLNPKPPKVGLGVEYVDTPEGRENAQKIGSLNLARMGLLEDQKKFIRERGVELEKAKKQISFDEIRQAAGEMGFTLKDSRGAAEFLKKNRGAWLAARDVAATLSVERDTAFKNWQEVSSKGEPQAIEVAAKALDAATERAMTGVVASAEVASEFGRGLATMRIESMNVPSIRYKRAMAELLERMKDKSKTGELPAPVVEMLRSVDLNDPMSMKRFIISQAPKIASWNDKFHEYWISMLLSNPTTHFRNLVGNSVALAGMPFETAASATAGAVMPGKRQTYFGEVPAQLYGMAHGVKGAWEGFKNGMKGELAEGKLDYGEGVLARAPKIAGVKGEVIRTPLRALQAADNAAKALVRSSSIYQQSYNMAAKEGLHGKALMDRAREIAKYPDEAMLTKAHSEAEYRTFQKQLGHWGQMALGARTTEIGKTGIKPLAYVAPFMTTPINLLKYGTERTPLQWLAVAKRGLGGEYKGGEGRRKAETDIGRAVIGSIIAQQVWSAVQNGDITGSGPTDQRERRAMVDAGWKPYSIRVGDRWVPMTNIDPASTSIMLVADTAEIWSAASGEERKKLAMMIVRAYGNNIQDKTYLSGLTSAMDAIDDPDRYAEKYLGRQAGSLVPSIVAGATKALDPYEREARTLTDQIKARVPGMREKIMPRRDIRGKKVEAAGTGVVENKAGETAFRWLSPVQPTGVRGGKIETLIAQMGEAIPAVPRKMSIDFPDESNPKALKKYRVELEPDEYDVYQQFRGEIVDQAFSSLEKNKENAFWQATEQDQKQIISSVVRTASEISEIEMLAWLASNNRLPEKYAGALKEEALKRKRSFAISLKEPNE